MPSAAHFKPHARGSLLFISLKRVRKHNVVFYLIGKAMLTCVITQTIESLADSWARFDDIRIAYLAVRSVLLSRVLDKTLSRLPGKSLLRYPSFIK